MFIAALSVALHFDQSRSLKEKRRLLKSIIERVKQRFNVSILEVADQDLWQKATIGITYLALSHYQAKKQAFAIRKFIESLNKATLSQFNYQIIKSDV